MVAVSAHGSHPQSALTIANGAQHAGMPSMKDLNSPFMPRLGHLSDQGEPLAAIADDHHGFT
jgi:hypothetical protein